MNDKWPLLIDLFCGAGGASMGYHRAGFRVIGVDHQPQKRYPFEFIQGDVFEVWPGLPHDEVVAYAASPPCQAFTNARVIHGRQYPDLLTPTRKLLVGTSKPWVIENVPNAPMRPDVILCGSMFGLKSTNGQLRRHRWFEFETPRTFLVSSCAHNGKTISVFGHGGHVYYGVEDWRRVMGIDWMTRDELSQAIPPAYTEWIGKQLMRVIG